METKTIRENIIDMIDGYGASPRELSQNLGIEEDRVFDEISHIKKSLDDRSVYVIPPECNNCGFNDFDNILNNPSKCPDCRNDSLSQPVFKID